MQVDGRVQQTVDAELDVLGSARRSLMEVESSLRSHYVAHGRYIDYLEFWLKVYNKERLLIMKSEDFFREPSAWFRRTTDFLGLTPWEPPEYADFKEPGRKTYTQYESGAYPEMLPRVRARLERFFTPYNESLRKTLGERFWWDNDAG